MKRLIIGLVMLAGTPALMAQTLEGVILKKGKPQKNMAVWVSGRASSAITDKEGRFALAVRQGDTLQVSVSGKLDAKVAVGDWKRVTITLDKENFLLDDGNGAKQLAYTPVPPMKKTSGVTHETIMRSGLRSVLDVVKRFVPGAQERAGENGERVFVIARGNNSLRTPAPPLFVVDGVPYEVGNINSIVAVQDIERLTVDRDGAEWGARGANGVVIITTLKGDSK